MAKFVSNAVAFGKSTAQAFMAHDAMSLAAAVAFYTALSFAPLVMIVMTIGGLLGETTQSQLIGFFEQQLGPRASEVTQEIIENAETAERKEPKSGVVRWTVSIAILFVTASAVFAQLQIALNRIWEVKPKPGAGVLAWIRKRLLSLGMVLAILFILLVSLVLSALVEQVAPIGGEVTARVSVLAASFIVTTLLFAAILKVLPDVDIPWRKVWWGAVVTSLLFSVGKLILSIYLEHGRVGQSYGQASGALIALLVWVYYSCVILFVGAEITRQYGRPLDAPKPKAAPCAPGVPAM